MNAQRLTEIRERLAKATAGPWECRDGEIVSLTVLDRKYSEPSYIGEMSDRFDESFIAHARTDVEDLLAEVERLRDALEQVEALSFFRGTIDDSEILNAAIYHAEKALKECD